MYTYTLINDDSSLATLFMDWKTCGIKRVAMDFEGEYNLHIYGEHLCLIQLFDGTSYALVDPFTISKEALKAFLEDRSVQKVMFDCASDCALVRKQYGIHIENIYDIRICALALGYTGNLTGLVERCLPNLVPQNTQSSKKKNQMTNWLNRPLKREQIEYALSDVEHLLDLMDLLDEEVGSKGLSEQVALQMKDAGKSKGPDKPGWAKFPSWKYLNRSEQTYLKHFFIARDDLARKYNVPAVRILEKHLLLDMAKHVPETDARFEAICNSINPRWKRELVEKLSAAKVKAQQELRP